MIKHMASCSGGKDSVAMIEAIIDRGMKLDEIVFAKVDKEFDQEAYFRDYLINRWEGMGRKCTVLETEQTWDDWFYGVMKKGNAKGKSRGYPLTAFPCWWSREAKFIVLDRYMKGHIRYIGIAFDEPKRYHPEKYDEGYRYPLVDFKMTESDCMKLCDERRVLNPLYSYFKRLGCYLCPKQGEDALKALCEFFPKEWDELMMYVKSTEYGNFCSPLRFNIKYDYKGLVLLSKEVHGTATLSDYETELDDQMSIEDFNI